MLMSRRADRHPARHNGPESGFFPVRARNAFFEQPLLPLDNGDRSDQNLAKKYLFMIRSSSVCGCIQTLRAPVCRADPTSATVSIEHTGAT
jgi:hypothetical protein